MGSHFAVDPEKLYPHRGSYQKLPAGVTLLGGCVSNSWVAGFFTQF